ncbi:MAG: DUF5715 family protein [Acidobacteriaceae bacterium]
MVCLTLCAAAMMAKPTRPTAQSPVAAVIAAQAGVHEHGARRRSRALVAAKGPGAWDSLLAGRMGARGAAGARASGSGVGVGSGKTVADKVAASKAGVGNAGMGSAGVGSAVVSSAAQRGAMAAKGAMAPVRGEAEFAHVDAATVQRVHAWEQAQREAAAEAAIKAADGEMDRAMRTGEVAADPVLWTAEVIYPRDAGAGAGTVVAGGGRPGAGSAAQSLGSGGAAASGARQNFEATAAVPLPSLYNSRGSLVVPPPLFGSREILLRQNEMAERDGLDRVRDDADLASLRREKKLVALPVNETVAIDPRLPENRRYARPWTADFLAVFARDFYAEFHEPVQVNSAVRTVEFQRRLERVNGNAAPASGDAASPHLTGEAVDIAKRGLSLAETAWMRAYLQPLIEQGKIDVEEEFQQACFHVSVYEKYLPGAAPRFTVAASRQGAGLP